MKADLVIKNIGVLATMQSKNTPVVGKDMNKVHILENAYIGIKDGKFIDIGIGEDYKGIIDSNTKINDAHGLLVTPGLIDAHTHLVHGGSRENEFSKKI